jgi:hypothetical protein
MDVLDGELFARLRESSERSANAGACLPVHIVSGLVDAHAALFAHKSNLLAGDRDSLNVFPHALEVVRMEGVFHPRDYTSSP